MGRVNIPNNSITVHINDAKDERVQGFQARAQARAILRSKFSYPFSQLRDSLAWLNFLPSSGSGGCCSMGIFTRTILHL